MAEAMLIERHNDSRQKQRNGGSAEGYGPAAKMLMGGAAGVAGTWALDRADWFMWRNVDEDARARTNRVRPNGEPPAHVVASKLEQALSLNPTPQQHEITALAVHYGIGIAPAIAYALVRDKLPISGVPRGLLYGLSLFLLQDEILNSVTGLGASPRKYPWQAHARGLVAHLVYGVATELMLELMEKSVNARRQG